VFKGLKYTGKKLKTEQEKVLHLKPVLVLNFLCEETYMLHIAAQV